MQTNQLHLKAPGNWINDPNGFIYYKGMYHLFYQYFPYAPVWGTMHWGHAVSKDLVHWQHKGVALFPTKSYDQNGIFSGSAIEKDGKLYLYYSAVRYLEQEPENIHQAKDGKFETSQAMLVSDNGELFDNWNKKQQIIPVIRDEAIADAVHTRDPKVWKENDRYYMVLGSTREGKNGRIVVFGSEDACQWEYVSQCKSPYGDIMECPDLFTVGDKRVFIGSPMGIGLDDKEYANHSVCTFADFDPKSGCLKINETYQRVDYGGDLYAPQSNLDAAGRRVLIAWMRMPLAIRTNGEKAWNGMMCLPRVVEIRDGHICFSVHPNVEAAFAPTDRIKTAMENGQPVRFCADLKDGDTTTIGGYRIWMEHGCICTDRSKVFPTDGHGIYSRTPQIEGTAHLEIFVEPNLIELFINNGFYVISHVVYGLGSDIEGAIYDEKVFMQEEV